MKKNKGGKVLSFDATCMLICFILHCVLMQIGVSSDAKHELR